MSLADLIPTDTECINLETYRRDGRGIRTPVWFIVRDDVLYLRTARRFGKTARVKNEPAVRFAACNWDGDLSGPWYSGRAVLLEDDDPVLAAVDRAMDEKYGDRRREMTSMMAAQGEALVYIRITAS